MQVEVVFPRVCGAFYEAYIQDINIDNGSAFLSFPKEWKPSVWVDMSYIRFPLEPTATTQMTFSVGTKVEAFLPHHDNEPPGWWTGTLLKSRGELHVVEFQSGTEKYQDIVDHDKLRSPNTNLPLSKNKMFRKEFEVAEDLDDYCQRRGVHENFRSKIRAICVSYDRTNRLLIVLATNETCLERAMLLIEMHFRDLRTQKSLLSKSEVAAQRYHHQSHHPLESGLKEIRFHVPQELVGMAIGREGANVNEARKISGVTSVEFDDYSSMFSVKGEDDEAMQRARERLEFNREVMMIPRNLAGKVIGKKGNIIQEILEKSRVHNVKVVGDEEARGRNLDVETQVPFDFIGRKIEIDNAKMMMEYHLDHLKSVEKILQSSRDMDPVPNHDETYFPAPSVTRGSRVGSGRGRGGRGSFRGGSRGGRQRESQTTEDGEDTPPGTTSTVTTGTPESRELVVREESEEIFQSDDSDSDSNQGQQENEGSAPEDDEQGPDRRRQYRGSGGGGRGGRGDRRRGGGGGGGRGGGGGGRGGRGYRNQRQGRGGGRYRNTDDRGQLPHDTNITPSENRVAGAMGGGDNAEGAEPKPQRQGRSRQRASQDRRGGGSGGRSNRDEPAQTTGEGGGAEPTA